MRQTVRRTRLVEQLLASPTQSWALEAGAGYGKSMLLKQLQHEAPVLYVPAPGQRSDLIGFMTVLTEAIRLSGADLGNADLNGLELHGVELTSSKPQVRPIVHALNKVKMAIVADDCHRWDGTVMALLQAIANDPVLGVPILIAGRVLDPETEPVGPAFHTIGSQELAFDDSEIGELLIAHGVDDRSASAMLLDLTDGWPLAAVTAVERMAAGPDPARVLRRLGHGGSLIRDLVVQHLLALPVGDSHAVAELAALPFFDAHLADLAGTAGTLHRLRTAGLPISRRPDAWLEFTPAVRSALLLEQVPAVQPKLVEYLAERGEIDAAITAYLTVGDHFAAAELIAGLSFSQEAQVEPATLGAAMVTIGDAADQRPRSLLVHTQVNASFGLIPEGRRQLERAVRAVDEHDRGLAQSDSLEIILTRSLWHVLEGDPVTAQQVLDRCLPHVSAASDQMLHARVHEIRGLISYTRGSREDLETSMSEQLKALAIWRQLAEPRPAAATVFRLMGPMSALGRHSRALQILDDLPSIGPMTMINQARLANEKCELLPFLGRSSEVPALLDQVRESAKALGHPWLASSTLGTEILAASLNPGAEEEVLALANRFIDEEHYVLNDLTQFIAWCVIAESLARCEHFDPAQMALERAAALDGPEILMTLASTSFEARAGDPRSALVALAALQDRSDVEHGQRWTLDLLAALCYVRVGDVAQAQSSLQACYAAAAELGEPQLPRIVEARIIQRLESAVPSEPIDQTVEINLFDEFAITIGGVAQPTPNSNATTLVKLIVLADSQMVLDQAITPLWPDTDLSVGRRRLRNVLLRVREKYGDVIDRDGDQLRLAPHVTSDLLEARRAAETALRPDRSAEELSIAIDCCDKQILPENRYDDWAEEARSDHRQLLVRLFDQQARLAQQTNDPALAAHALHRAASLSPVDSGRSDAAAALLRSIG